MDSLATRAASLGLLSVTLAATACADFGFVQGNIYTTLDSTRTIAEYTLAGTPVGSITLPASVGVDLRGLAFGPDGLLYAMVPGSFFNFNVVALNSAGVVQQTYTQTGVGGGGNLSYGKLALDSQYIYVATQDYLFRFAQGSPSSGVAIYNHGQTFDVNVLPNGNLLVATDGSIDEITTSGTFVRTIPFPGHHFSNIRGIQYNAATNKIFVAQLGDTGFNYSLLRLDATTGVLEKNILFNQAQDLFLTQTGELLVGRWVYDSGIFTQDLVQTGTIGTGSQLFVTQLTVPEPASAVLLLSGAALLGFRRRCGTAG